MVVHNLNVVGFPLIPTKTYSPLVIDSDAVLSLSSPAQGLQTVSRWNSEIIERLRPMEQQQLSSGYPLKCAKTWHVFISEQCFRRLGQKWTYYRSPVYSASRYRSSISHSPFRTPPVVGLCNSPERL